MGSGGRGATVSEFFFYKESKSKRKKKEKENFFVGEGGGGEVDGRTGKQARTNLPLQLLQSWGHGNA